MHERVKHFDDGFAQKKKEAIFKAVGEIVQIK